MRVPSKQQDTDTSGGLLLVDEGSSLQDGANLMDHSMADFGSAEFQPRASQTNNNNNNAAKEQAANNQQPALAKQETREVHRFRLLMMLLLLVFAVVVSTLVYFYAHNVEQNEFEVDFESNGLKVIRAFQEDSYRKMQALFSLSSAITSHALTLNATWPFVTIPNSASEFGPYLNLADAAALAIFPIVPPELRAEWEAYSVSHQDWIDHDLNVLNPNLEASTATMTTTTSNQSQLSEQFSTISPYIKNYVGVDTSPGIWTPWWQYHPVIPNRWFVNFNRLAWKGFPEQLNVVLGGKATLSQTITFLPGLDVQSTQDFEFTNELLQAGGRGRYDAGEPLSYISYPIFEDFGTDKEPAVAGVLVATVYWKSYFQNILADDVEGVICVVTNSGGQSFRYELKGRDAIFLGMGDDTSSFSSNYNDLKLSAEYSAGLKQTQTEQAQQDTLQYSGVPVDDEFIAYTLDVYPSQILEDHYMTNRPIYFALAIGAVFVLCAGIFVLYNNIVDRRQHLVLTTANKSAAVVNSIFPSNVRDRLMEELPGTNDAVNNTKTSGKTSSYLPSALTGGAAPASGSTEEKGPQDKKSSPPIADFFEGTTVFFADLKGFTSWCDSRQPVQVFTLLESLYGEFDKIAKRRQVYKVETIGDCYVAVTGLPQARKDHALVMARFSREVMAKFHQVVRDLDEALGEGTKDLGLRVGIHSGPVTAGVIRGDNARFQLFGDTVNTASRMESTSEGGRIQLSQSTADLLITAGKGHWFTAREEKVQAKGKGLLQTYWLTTISSKTNGAASQNSDTKPSLSCAESRSVESGQSGESGDDEMVSGDLSYLEDALKQRIDEEHQSRTILEEDA